jgi:hypothetical protein
LPVVRKGMSHRVRRSAVALLSAFGCICWLISDLQAQTKSAKPNPPVGVDPGGAAVGLLTTGIDYRLPPVAGCLARDGEGRVIAWDVIDRDPLPFRAHSVGVVDDNVLASSVDCNGRVRLVPVRIDVADAISFSRAVAFLATTPARVIVIPALNQPDDWTPLLSAADAFPAMLIVVARVALPAVDHPAAARANIAFATIPPAAGHASMLALARVVVLVACSRPETKESGAALKMRFDVLSAAADANPDTRLSPKC